MGESLETDIKSCVEIIARIDSTIIDAGRAIAEACDRHRGFLRLLSERLTGVSMTFLRRLERVGRGSLDPRIALGIEHGILAERLPMAEQCRIIDEGVEVAIGERGSDSMKLKLAQMDANTAGRVMRNGVIAPLPQQRAAIIAAEDAARRMQIKDNATRAGKRGAIVSMLKRLPVKLDIKQGTAIFSRPVTLTIAQLYMIISELEK